MIEITGNINAHVLKSPCPKPNFYATVLDGLKFIAKLNGYNLVVHGSMNRDLDLIAVPWSDEPADHLTLLQQFSMYLGCAAYKKIEQYLPSVLPGGRSAYIINLNRTRDEDGEDPQWYLDISITPFINSKQ